MTTPLMLIGMKYQTTLNSWLGAFPIEFNDKTRQYTYKIHPRDLKFYYFSVIYLLSSVNIGSALLVCFIHFFIHPVKGLTTTHIVLFGFLGGGLSFVVGIAIGVILFGSDSCLAINALLTTLENTWGRPLRKKRYPQTISGYVKRMKDLSRKENGSLDMIGIAIVYFASYSVWFPPFIFIASGILDLSPMTFLAREVFGHKFMSYWKPRFLSTVGTMIVIAINSAQTIRLIQVIVIMFIIPVQIYLKIFEKVITQFEKATTTLHHDKIHMRYAIDLSYAHFLRITN
jgi:hypothetical protein